MEMVHKFKVITTKIGKNNLMVEKLKTRGRKGIPDNMRAIVWTAFGRIDAMIPVNYKGSKQDWFIKCCKVKSSKDDVACIYKDIKRTLTTHTFLKQNEGVG